MTADVTGSKMLQSKNKNYTSVTNQTFGVCRLIVDL